MTEAGQVTAGHPLALVIAGPPGAGKSTVARLVSTRLTEPSVCLESDWFWTTITRGFIPPWKPESDHQNRVVIQSVAAAAAELATGGYQVVIDGVIGPWTLPLVREKLTARGVGVHYVVLRPDLGTCLARAVARQDEAPRVPGHPPLAESGPIRHLWSQFANIGNYEGNVIDTTALDPIETTDAVLDALKRGALVLEAP